MKEGIDEIIAKETLRYIKSISTLVDLILVSGNNSQREWVIEHLSDSHHQLLKQAFSLGVDDSGFNIE